MLINWHITPQEEVSMLIEKKSIFQNVNILSEKLSIA